MKTLKFIIVGAMFSIASTVAAQVNNNTINIQTDTNSTGNQQQQPVQQQQQPVQQQPATVITPVVVPTPTPAPAPAQVVVDEDDEPTFHGGEFGIRYMPTFSVFRLTNPSGGTVKGEFVMGHGFGAFIGANSKHVGVQLEAIYTSSGQRFEDNGRETEVNVNYLSVPLLLTLNTDKSKPVNFNIAFGPQVGFNAGASVTTSGTSNEVNGTVIEPVIAVKKSDFGFAYGAGLEFALNDPRTVRLNFGFRGVYGLIDIRDNSQTVTTNQYVVLDRTNTQAYAGYLGLSFMF
jgi:opacity protein-like surface antigen